MSEVIPTALFVYGTLQQGEERERFWPRRPLQILPASIIGALYDLGPYPALIPGEEVIGGELWILAPAAIEVTLAALDEVECYGQGGVDLYVRRVVQCRTEGDETRLAYTYFLADESLARRHTKVSAGDDGVCRWHRYRPRR